MATLQPFVDAHALLVMEQQLHLTDVIGGRDFAVDLEAGRARFGGELEYATELVGSEAPGPATWMWGWANPAGFGDHVTATARSLRALGEERDWPALSEGEVPLDADVSGPRIAILAVGRAGAPAYYAAPLGGGGCAYLLLDGPDLELPPPELPRVVRALNLVLEGGEVDDWPTALGTYAGQRGLGLRRRDDTMYLASPELDGRVRVRFDDLGRVAGISATGGGESRGLSMKGAATRRGLFSRLLPPAD
jgi:hypothetical protein